MLFTLNDDEVKRNEINDEAFKFFENLDEFFERESGGK